MPLCCSWRRSGETAEVVSIAPFAGITPTGSEGQRRVSWRYLSRPFPPAPLVNVRHGILTVVRRSLAAALAGLVIAPATAAGQAPCSSPLTADGVPVKPGPALRMGLTPSGEAGGAGPAAAGAAPPPPHT